MSLSIEGVIKIGDVLLQGKNIAEVLPISEYYDQHPDKRPHGYGQRYLPLPDLPPVTNEDVVFFAKKIIHLEALIRGFKRSSKNPDGPILKKMEERREQILMGNVEPAAGRMIYNPRYKYDPEKETWPEFNARVAAGVEG